MRLIFIRSVIVLFLLAFSAYGVFAQRAQVQTNSSSLTDWRQANTVHFKVLYPKTFKTEGLSVLQDLENLYIPGSNSLGLRPRKISVVMRNENSVSNGFVSMSPRHSEFFTTPPQDYNHLGSNDWLHQLSVHEYRHVVQNERILTGPTKWVYWLFGEQTAGAVAYYASPEWFWEGDAVMAETALTQSGRGRIPEFSVALKANLLEKGLFTYSKQALRSFKDFVPNHYVTGFYLVSYLRRENGEDAVADIQRRAVNKFYLPFTWGIATEKVTGKNTLENYQDAWSELRNLWREQVDEVNENSFQTLNNRPDEIYTDYKYPRYLSDGSVLAYRTGMSNPGEFVFVEKDGNAKYFKMPGIVNEAGMLSVENDKVIWAEYGYGTRWRARSFSNIKIWNTRTGEKTKLTHRGRLAGPALSKDGKRVVAVETMTSGEFALVFLNAESGAEEGRYKMPKNSFPAMASWSEDGRYVYYTKVLKNRKTMARYDVNSQKEEHLVPWSSENYGHPQAYGNYLYYNSAVGGIDDIYALDLETRQQFKVTSAKYGAYNPAIADGGQRMLYNNYTVNGMDVAETELNPSLWTPLSKVKNISLGYIDPVVEQERKSLEELAKAKSEEKHFEDKPYSSFTHLVRPYAWGLTATTDFNNVELGVISKNILSTMVMSGGYIFDQSEGKGIWRADVSYQGWYPIIDFSFENRGRSDTAFLPVGRNRFEVRNAEWRETTWEAGLRLPFRLTDSKLFSNLTFGTYFGLTQVNDYPYPGDVKFIDRQENGDLYSMRYTIQYSLTQKTSFRDFAPRWGLTSLLYFRHTPFGGDYEGKIFTTNWTGYLPGLAKHHTLQLRASYQRTSPDNYSLPSPVFFPRGYSYQIFKDLYVGSVYYGLPIAYPDWEVGPLVNIQRIRVAGLADFGRGKDGYLLSNVEGDGMSKDFFSFGGEVTVDANYFRFLPLVSMGVRYVRVPDNKDNNFYFIFGLNF
ncbi:hypothetical protein FUAX_11850 [Fulvitalea axinellae]|uniref:WD40-like Beta Propeller Repeat n=1 Tax=Fulvitalea axinellae TaxID=1182444 RepID=A0AAU9CYL2_9BACT|nr:hypothetical protein FUAX_11850 [Fulvitalea axinellae]